MKIDEFENSGSTQTRDVKRGQEIMSEEQIMDAFR